MIAFLLQRVLKTEPMESEKGRQRVGVTLSGIGVGFNLLLFLGKALAGWISGSVAIVADAFNNLSDAASSVITLVGFYVSGRKPDKDHPFGHGRAEYLCGLAVSLLILWMGFELGKTSFAKILTPEAVRADGLVYGILLVSILIKGYMFLYNRAYAKRLSSTAMQATAIDSLSDAAATSVVLLSAVVSEKTGWMLDGYCGLLVAAFILKAGVGAMKETLNPLLGEAPDPILMEQIKSIAEGHQPVLGVHDLIVHDYGPGRRMVSLHLEVPGELDVFTLHEVVDHIEREIKERLHCETVIHMDPVATDDDKQNRLKKQMEQALRVIDEELTLHDFRMIKKEEGTIVSFDILVPSECASISDELKTQFEDMLKVEGYFPQIEIDRSYE